MQHTKPIVRCALASPWGAMTLAAHDTALVWVGFDGQKHAPDLGQWPVQQNHPLLQRAHAQLNEYFSGQRHNFDLPLDFSKGTAFQQNVWQQLLRIAPGATTSYGAISQRMDCPRAVRAVGAAVGRNPISIIVPCHRVLGSNGAMTGYAGGLERKVALLQLEGSL
jgi:methylated-DNA-[protein]-cysteine S-methyltransferase